MIEGGTRGNKEEGLLRKLKVEAKREGEVPGLWGEGAPDHHPVPQGQVCKTSAQVTLLSCEGGIQTQGEKKDKGQQQKRHLRVSACKKKGSEEFLSPSEGKEEEPSGVQSQ